MGYRQELGRATWWHLHWAAQQPGAAAALYGLVDLLRRSYPCRLCRDKLPQTLARLPPRPLDDDDVPLWMSTFHNGVRLSLGDGVVLGPASEALRGPLRVMYGGQRAPPPHHDADVRKWVALMEMLRLRILTQNCKTRPLDGTSR